METKVCSKCNTEKDVTEFYSYGGRCKLCVKERSKIYRENNKEKIIKDRKDYYKKNKDRLSEKSKKYYKNNKDKIREITKIYRENNIDKLKEHQKKYYQKNKQRIRSYRKEYGKVYRENNKEKINSKIRRYRKHKRQSDSLYKVKENIRVSIINSFIRYGYTKNSRTFEILGCPYEEFKLHIESQWEDWMNWDNHGLYNGEENCGWDLDHIIPVSSAKCEEDIIRLNHHSNIQPLCSYVNRHVKRDIVDWKS